MYNKTLSLSSSFTSTITVNYLAGGGGAQCTVHTRDQQLPTTRSQSYFYILPSGDPCKALIAFRVGIIADKLIILSVSGGGGGGQSDGGVGIPRLTHRLGPKCYHCPLSPSHNIIPLGPASSQLSSLPSPIFSFLELKLIFSSVSTQG